MHYFLNILYYKDAYNKIIRLKKMSFYQIWKGNKIENKLHQLYTPYITGVTRTIIALFGFINWQTEIQMEK